MKKIPALILSSLFLTSTALAYDANWRIHPIFDEEVSHVVETPKYVYFTSRQVMKNTSYETFFSLFRFDKEGEELMPLSTSNLLNGNSVKDMIYNPEKGYLAVLYKDFEIDLLYNDGTVTFIPYYAQASISYPKDVHSLSIDPSNDRLYLATDFGYVAINDKKNEVAESRLYGESFQSFCRMGEYYLVARDNEILMAPASAPRLSVDQYEPVEKFNNQVTFYPLSDNFCIVAIGNPDNNTRQLKLLSLNSSKPTFKDLFSANILNIDYNSKGLIVTTDKEIYQFLPDGNHTSVEKHENFANSSVASDNLVEFWNAEKRKGLSSVKSSGEQWSLTRDWMLPDSPATFATTSFVNHPNKGFLMLNYGYSWPTYQLNNLNPLQLSGYKNGRWTNYAPAYTNPERINLLNSTSGMAVDPDNNNLIYISSYHKGIARINLNDPNDIIHLSHKNDNDKDNEGFIIFPLIPELNPNYSNKSQPNFDKQGNLWIAYPNWDNQADPKPNYYVWLAADRKATTSANDIRMPQRVEFDTFCPITNFIQSIVLTQTGKGIIVHTPGSSDEKIIMIDTNGTPLDLDDDKIYSFPDFTDADGNEVKMERINYIWEDPVSGNVWVCHVYGVGYFVPSQVRNGKYVFNRVKVSRNDGTNLADYLLDGVSVNYVTGDADGRKWFATAGGVVCTSFDGREILEEFNTSNSPLPDDIVYGIGYNSETNSLMFSTNQGYAEYMLPVSQASTIKEDIRAYPNPVRPEYSGYVTITDIPVGSFVKIVNAAGSLVKELGVMSGFEILWDLSDSNFNRVKSGVYHILVSPSDENSSYSTVGKILVMS